MKTLLRSKAVCEQQAAGYNHVFVFPRILLQTYQCRYLNHKLMITVRGGKEKCHNAFTITVAVTQKLIRVLLSEFTCTF